MSLKTFFREFLSRDRRRNDRQRIPQLVAFYWDGDAPMAHGVRDISPSGLYLLTEGRWYPGTLVMLTLQKNGEILAGSQQSIAVEAKVIRSGDDGVGLAFVLPERRRSDKDSLVGNLVDKRTLVDFLEKAKNGLDVGTQKDAIEASKKSLKEKGQALVEYALMLPFIFLLIVNLVNFGGLFYAWITVANAARAGADYAVLGGASVGYGLLSAPSGASINAVITKEISSLPNSASTVVNVCKNNSGTLSNLYGSCTASADPETNYVLILVDVTYTYKPYIPGFNFPSLNIYTTLPPTTIHRATSIRSIQ
jgi:Flp pilus assembly protein TadG